MFNENEFEYKHNSSYKTMKRFYNLKQERHTSNANCLEKFQNTLEVVQITGGDLGTEPGLVKAPLNSVFVESKIIDATPTQLEHRTRDVRDMYASIAYLMPSDKNRYDKSLEDFANQNAQLGIGRAVPWPHYIMVSVGISETHDESINHDVHIMNSESGKINN